MPEIVCLHESKDILGEGPIWNELENKLYWCDNLRPRVSPARIVLGHAHNESGYLLHDSGPSRPAPMNEIPLLGDKSSMPAQQSIGRNDRVQLQQRLAPHCLGLSREQRSLGVGEPDTLSAQPVFE